MWSVVKENPHAMYACMVKYDLYKIYSTFIFKEMKLMCGICGLTQKKPYKKVKFSRLI